MLGLGGPTVRALSIVLSLMSCRPGPPPEVTAPAEDTGPRHTPPFSSPEHCSDGLDNDLDGWVDGSDHDCPLAGEVSLLSADLLVEGQPYAVLDVDGDGVPELIMDARSDGGAFVAVDLGGTPIAMDLDLGYPRHVQGDLDGDGVADLMTRDIEASPWPTSIFPGPLTEVEPDAPWLRFSADYHGHSTMLRVPGAGDDGETLLAVVGNHPNDHWAYLFPESIPLDATLEDHSVAQLFQWGYDSDFGIRVEAYDTDGDGVAEIGILDDRFPDWPYDAHGWVYLVPGSMRGTQEPAAAASFLLEGSYGHEVDDFVLPGDLTGDGYGDVAVLVDKHALLLEGPLEGTLHCADIRDRTHTAYEPQRVTALHLAGDVNGDGRPGLALDRGEEATVVFFHATGGIITEPSLEFDYGTTPSRDVFAAGFDADGDGLGELVLQDGGAFYLFAGR